MNYKVQLSSCSQSDVLYILILNLLCFWFKVTILIRAATERPCASNHCTINLCGQVYYRWEDMRYHISTIPKLKLPSCQKDYFSVDTLDRMHASKLFWYHRLSASLMATIPRILLHTTPRLFLDRREKSCMHARLARSCRFRSAALVYGPKHLFLPFA